MSKILNFFKAILAKFRSLFTKAEKAEKPNALVTELCASLENRIKAEAELVEVMEETDALLVELDETEEKVPAPITQLAMYTDLGKEKFVTLGENLYNETVHQIIASKMRAPLKKSPVPIHVV